MNALRITAALLAASLAALAVATPAAAHASQTTEDGRYRVTWGLLSEPGYTHEKNRLDLIIRETLDAETGRTGAGVDGVTAENITIRLRYLDEVYELGNVTSYRGPKNSGSFAGPGNYTSTNHVYLTRPGVYALEIVGDIHGTPVNMTIRAAHPYDSMQEIMFPEEIELGGAGGSSDLEARVAALEAKTDTMASTPAGVSDQESPVPGSGLLVAALAATGAALILRRRG